MFETFYTADVTHYDVLLGRDWLAQVEPDTRWEKQSGISGIRLPQH
jgi:hypothetical protein